MTIEEDWSGSGLVWRFKREDGITMRTHPFHIDGPLTISTIEEAFTLCEMHSVKLVVHRDD